MKKVLKVVLSLLLIVVLAAGCFYVWAGMRVTDLRARTIATHTVDFPVPFPLAPSDADALGPDSAAEVAEARAVERGKHLIESRYVCTECHGANLGGGTMIDDPAIGTVLGPNITTGQGSVVLDYDAADWDRAVRHGVAPSGRPTLMPAQDFQMMSDQELSDILAYIRTVPPVDNQVEPLRVGPVGRILLALGQIRFAADEIARHDAPHPDTPPVAEASVEFGKHLSGVCTGCHRANLSGGPIAGGDPSWPTAANLTPHADGLAAWSYEDFVRAMREAKKPDGSDLLQPMVSMTNFTRNMSETELQALWMYLGSLPATPTGD
ncbi:MAG: c-type cytochrome [Gemmatimonadales bacterium]